MIYNPARNEVPDSEVQGPMSNREDDDERKGSVWKETRGKVKIAVPMEYLGSRCDRTV